MKKWYESIYEKFNEVSLFAPREYGFEALYKGEWTVVLKNKYDFYSLDSGSIATFNDLKIARQEIKNAQRDLKIKDIRIVEGGRKSHYPI